MRSLKVAISSTSARFLAILSPYTLAAIIIPLILHFIERPGDGVVPASLDLLDSFISSTTPFWVDMLNAYHVRSRYNERLSTLETQATISEETASHCFQLREWHRRIHQRSSTPLVRAFAEQTHRPNYRFEDYVQTRIDRYRLWNGMEESPTPDQMKLIYLQIMRKATQSARHSTILATNIRRCAILLMSLRAIIAITIAIITTQQEESIWAASLKDEAFRMVIAIGCASSALGTAVIVQVITGVQEIDQTPGT